jgi:hypothetical protein
MLAVMTIPAARLERVVANAGVSAEDVRRALAIACLAVAADGKLADEEVTALRVMSTALDGFPAASLDALMQSSLNLPNREDRVEQLRATADSLTSDEARHLAYKMSIAMALADSEAADAEFEFDLDVQEALSLSPATADRLTAEVHQAVQSSKQ